MGHRFVITDNMIIASFLDPSTHKLPAISRYLSDNHTDMMTLLVKKWKQYDVVLQPSLKSTENNKKASKPKVAKPSAAARLRLSLLEKHIGRDISHDADLDLEDAISKEYLQYVSVSTIVEDPLSWWREHSGAFPHLSSLARVMLSIPVASGSTERHFSETGALITKRKAQLDALNAERIMFIHDNFKHVEKLG